MTTLQRGFLRFFATFLLLMTPMCASAGTVLASWYGREREGHKTANGDVFNSRLLTAASRDYPFGTYLRVTNVTNGASVLVLVNDRGPGKHLHRAIDVSQYAAEILGFKESGLARVTVEVVR